MSILDVAACVIAFWLAFLSYAVVNLHLRVRRLADEVDDLRHAIGVQAAEIEGRHV